MPILPGKMGILQLPYIRKRLVRGYRHKPSIQPPMLWDQAKLRFPFPHLLDWDLNICAKSIGIGYTKA